VLVSKKKFFTINLNPYRNAHHFTLDKAKKEFFSIVKNRVKHIPPQQIVRIDYVLFPRTKQECDVSNVCSIQDKFFSDTLVECGIIPDDNYNFLPKVTYSFGEIDKHNPRVEATITPITENQEMQITTKSTTVVTLDDTDLDKALRAYLVAEKVMDSAQAAEASVELTKGGAIVRFDSETASEPQEAPKKAQEPQKRLEPAEAMTALLKKEEKTEEASPEPEKKEETPAPASPGKSLFAGLKRPQN